MDVERSYTRQGISTLVINDNVELIDHSNPSEEKEYTGSDAISALKEMVLKNSKHCGAPRCLL